MSITNTTIACLLTDEIPAYKIEKLEKVQNVPPNWL